MKYIDSEQRPWGKFYVIHDEPNYKLKRIEVEPGFRLSYQYHKYRSEAWTVVYGSGLVTIDSKDQKIKTGDTIIIPLGVKHRIKNISKNAYLKIKNLQLKLQRLGLKMNGG